MREVAQTVAHEAVINNSPRYWVIFIGAALFVSLVWLLGQWFKGGKD